MSKVFILGIDGAPPEFVFGEWLDELPNIKKLIEKGSFARLNSTIPPLSAVAWTAISTGKNPSDNGFFEYVYRKNNSYTDTGIISSLNVKEKTIWQIASENNKKSIICLMPLLWPIKPFNGMGISGFMTPSTNVDYCYPKEIKKEIEKLFPEGFIINSSVYRDIPEKKILENAHNITEMHFELMKHLLKKKWDLFFGVIIESDAINHNFLKYEDQGHRKYNKRAELNGAMKKYYMYVDKKLGELMSLLDKDTKIIILSDHGIKRMHNRINLSDWLIKEGYMVLKEEVKEKLNQPIKLDLNMVDWGKTKAWAIGAFEGQIFINLKGREEKGIVEKENYEKLIKELSEKIKKITGDDGKNIDTRIFVKKKDFDGKRIEEAPDLIIYFDNLQYGCNTSLIGNKGLHQPFTAKGSDDAGHSKQGILIMSNKGEEKNTKKDLGEVDITEVSKIIFELLNLNVSECVE